MTFTIAGLVQLMKNPKIAEFANVCEALFSSSNDGKQAIANLASALTSVAQEVDVPLHFDIGSSSSNVKGEGHACNVRTTPDRTTPDSSIPNSDVGEIDDQSDAVTVCSPTLEEPIAEELEQSYANAAAAKVEVVIQHTATMPTFRFGFIKQSGEPLYPNSRTAHLDTGCNCNLMSKRALVRDKRFLGPSARIIKIRPFKVGLADGKAHTLTCLAVQDVSMLIRDAKYRANFLVVENLAQDYLLGMPWIITYDAQILAQNSKMMLGAAVEDWVSSKPHRFYQEIDLEIRVKKMAVVASKDDNGAPPK